MSRWSAALLVVLSGCNLDPSLDAAAGAPPGAVEAAPAAGVERETGTLSFELRGAGGLTLSTFDYVVTGPNFTKSGSIDVSNSTTVSARIDAIPAASGYSVTLSGSGVGTPKAQCSGSASFDVLARSVSNVPVAISCHVEDSVVTPPETVPTGAPVPPLFAWLCGLAFLAIGSRFATERSRLKSLG